MSSFVSLLSSSTRALFPISISFFFPDTAPAEIYTLSYTTLFRSSGLRSGPRGHDRTRRQCGSGRGLASRRCPGVFRTDRKSTRLNSSHDQISYAVFCLKKKNADTDVSIIGLLETADEPEGRVLTH